MANLYRLLKRVFDFSVAVTGIVLLWPLLLLIAIAVKFDSNGPLFFTQQRLTEKERIFRIIKFRTMKKNARKIQFEKKISPDKLITKIGHTLRETHLDELCQLANIFFGDMSVIGPRPLILENELNRIKQNPSRKKRYDVKVGVSGIERLVNLMPDRKKIILKKLLNANFLINSKDNLDYDLYYAKNISAKTDFILVIETIRLIFRKLKENFFTLKKH